MLHSVQVGGKEGHRAAQLPGGFPADAFNTFSVAASGPASDEQRAPPDKSGSPLWDGIAGTAYEGFAKSTDL